jgi:hypothetical protein
MGLTNSPLRWNAPGEIHRDELSSGHAGQYRALPLRKGDRYEELCLAIFAVSPLHGDAKPHGFSVSRLSSALFTSDYKALAS